MSKFNLSKFASVARETATNTAAYLKNDLKKDLTRVKDALVSAPSKVVDEFTRLANEGDELRKKEQIAKDLLTPAERPMDTWFVEIYPDGATFIGRPGQTAVRYLSLEEGLAANPELTKEKVLFHSAITRLSATECKHTAIFTL